MFDNPKFPRLAGSKATDSKYELANISNVPPYDWSNDNICVTWPSLADNSFVHVSFAGRAIAYPNGNDVNLLVIKVSP